MGGDVMIRPSASVVPLLLACPGSAHLQHADYKSKWADLGDDRHGDAEAAADLRDDDELPRQVRAMLEPGDQLSAECAFMIDVSDESVRALGHIKREDYPPAGPFEIPGKVDLIIYGTRRVIVVDYKGFEEVDSAATNEQLATYALMVARAGGLLEITVAIVYLGADWRPADVATLYAMDLDAHAERLRGMMTSSDRTIRVNKHCKYCHAFLFCPEQKRFGEEAAGGALAVRVEAMIPFANDDDAADAFELLQRVKMFAARLTAAVYARAAERPIPLRNGKMFGAVAKQGNEKLDGDMVYEVMKELHGQTRADRAVARVATKKQLAMAIVGLPGAKAKNELAVLTAVRERGGATRSAGTAIEEYTPGPRLVTDEPAALPAGEKPHEGNHV
jgi:hypothetical protein